jgi:hypothetical protein
MESAESDSPRTPRDKPTYYMGPMFNGVPGAPVAKKPNVKLREVIKELKI